MSINKIGVERISEFSKKFSVISTHLGYKKFVTSKPRVLYFFSTGWIASEVLDALKADSYPLEVMNVSHLNPDNKNLTLDDYIHFHKDLIKKLLEFKPDCILTINHAAFDSIGLLSKILEQFKMPFISWFVDSPLYIFKNSEPQKSNYLYLFSWEKSYVKRLHELGFSSVFFLPLASGHQFISEESVSEVGDDKYKCDVAFVGNSNKENTRNWFDKEFANPKLAEISDEAVRIQIENSEKEMRYIIKELDSSKILDKYDDLFRLSFEVYCVLHATEVFREKVVSALSQNFNFKIFGDLGWAEDYPENYVCKLDYYKDLPKLYSSAKIIVNVTNFQMNTAINQRVYDVFFSGGFLVSDYRQDYDKLFGKGMIPTFRKIDELVDSLKFYLADEPLRKDISKKIKTIIEEKHLYTMRIGRLFETVKNNYHE